MRQLANSFAEQMNDMVLSSTISPTATISQIYGAFDEASHKIFRQAMRRSHGGLVRVADLAAALADVVPDVCRMVFPPRWVSVPPPNDQQEVPMANEPALRDLLRQAFLVGSAQPGVNETAITPAVLVGVLASRHPTYSVRRPAEVFQSLSLVLPPGFQLSPTTYRQDSVVGRWIGPMVQRENGAAAVPAAGANVEGLVLDILQQWVEAQELPAGSDRRTRLAKCASLAGGLNRATTIPAM